MRTKRRNFTSREDEFIRSNYRTMPFRDIARHLNRIPKSIRHRAGRLGVTKPLKRWGDEENKFILSSHGKRELREVARTLGRRVSEVSYHLRSIGIEKWRTRSGFHSGRAIDGFKVGGKPVYTHRRVVEDRIGRKLRSDEIVHHIDGIKTNNADSNLYLFKSRSAHRSAHMSFESIIPILLERGIVRFNSTTGVYELCEINK